MSINVKNIRTEVDLFLLNRDQVKPASRCACACFQFALVASLGRGHAFSFDHNIVAIPAPSFMTRTSGGGRQFARDIPGAVVFLCQVSRCMQSYT